MLTPEEVFERAKKFSEMGAEEIHIIGGIYSKLPLSYYIDIIRAVKSADPKLNIVAFTASECAAMAKASGLPLGEVFERLKAAGVNALPGVAPRFSISKCAIKSPPTSFPPTNGLTQCA